METKSSIRKKMLALRDGMSCEERRIYSRKIADILLDTEILQKAETVLCFAGYKSEVQTEELMEALFALGKKVYLPRVDGEDMDFYRINSLGDLTEGYKGIPEPAKTCTDIFTIDDYESKDSTVMLMPGAVFATDGSRIGYGKGFYDRYLVKCDIMNRIALCFAIQLTERIPGDVHDKKASVIVTEKGITECGKV